MRMHLNLNMFLTAMLKINAGLLVLLGSQVNILRKGHNQVSFLLADHSWGLTMIYPDQQKM